MLRGWWGFSALCLCPAEVSVDVSTFIRFLNVSLPIISTTPDVRGMNSSGQGRSEGVNRNLRHRLTKAAVNGNRQALCIHVQQVVDHVIVSNYRRRYRGDRRHASARGPSSFVGHFFRRNFTGTGRRRRSSRGRRSGRRQRFGGVVRMFVELRMSLFYFQVSNVSVNRRDTGRRYRRRRRRRSHVNCRQAAAFNGRLFVDSVVSGMGDSRGAHRRRRNRSRGRVPSVNRYVRSIPAITPVASRERRFIRRVPLVSVRVQANGRDNRDTSRRRKSRRAIGRRGDLMNLLSRRITHFTLGFVASDLRRGARGGGRPRPMNPPRANAVGREGQDGGDTARDSRHNGYGFPFTSNEICRRLAVLFNFTRAGRREITALRGRWGCRCNPR